MKVGRVDNPDPEGIYHIWHVCKACGLAWTHSQGDWEGMKLHVRRYHGDDWSVIIDIPTRLDFSLALIPVKAVLLRWRIAKLELNKGEALLVLDKDNDDWAPIIKLGG